MIVETICRTVQIGCLRPSLLWGMLLGLCLSTALPAEGPAVDGVSSGQIVFGQSCPLQGPAAALGENMRLGLLTAFEEVNRAGGIYGRELKLVSLDDGYEPEAAAENAYSLLTDYDVFALVGCVGTPTTRSIRAVTFHTNVPIVGPFTGADSLRNPPKFDVINVRASYAQELERLTAAFVDEQGITRIACLYQSDAFGLTCLNGLEAALQRRGLAPIAIAPFERNTLAVKAAFLTLRRAEPEAIVMIGTSKPCATFISTAQQLDSQSLIFGSVSFVGVDALARDLGPIHAPCYVTEVVPNPQLSTLPIVEDFRSAIERQAPGATPNYVNLEGYTVGRFVIRILEQVGEVVTRDAFVAEAKLLTDSDLAGLTIMLSETDNQALDNVFLSCIRNGVVYDEDGPTHEAR